VDRPPDAWAVWSAWEGDRDALAAVCRQVGRQSEAPARLELETRTTTERVDAPDDLTTIPKTRFRRLRAARISARGEGVEIRCHFVRSTRSNAPDEDGTGVILRVWKTNGTEEEVTRARDNVAAVVDDGHAPLSGDMLTGGAPDSVQEAVKAAGSKRDNRIVNVALAVSVGPLLAAAVLHKLIDIRPGASQVGDVILFCVCNPAVFLVVGGAALIAAFVAVPRALPAVEISDNPTWRRLIGPLTSFGAVTYLGGQVLKLAFGG
jgi:hypothetical protein